MALKKCINILKGLQYLNDSTTKNKIICTIFESDTCMSKFKKILRSRLMCILVAFAVTVGIPVVSNCDETLLITLVRETNVRKTRRISFPFALPIFIIL